MTSQVSPSALILLLHVFLSTFFFFFVRPISSMTVSHAAGRCSRGERKERYEPGKEVLSWLGSFRNVMAEQEKEGTAGGLEDAIVSGCQSFAPKGFTYTKQRHVYRGNGSAWNCAVCRLHGGQYSAASSDRALQRKPSGDLGPQEKCSVAPRMNAAMNPVFLLSEPPSFLSAKPLCPPSILTCGLFSQAKIPEKRKGLTSLLTHTHIHAHTHVTHAHTHWCLAPSVLRGEAEAGAAPSLNQPQA